jgi:uncharacterized membrane protein
MASLFRDKTVIRNLSIVIAGALLYGISNRLMSGLLLPGADFITFRPQLVIPVTVSLLAGPFSGGFIGLFGNFFGDLLSGYGLQFWPWSIANFLIGFMPGMVRWFGVSEIKKVNAFALVLLFIFLGNVLGLFEGFLVYSLVNGHHFLEVMNAFYLPALISNSYLLLLLMPPLLVLTHFLKLNIETRSIFFVLIFSLTIVSLLSAVFMIAEYRMFSTSLSSLPGINEIMQQTITLNFRWIGLLLLVIVIAAGIIGYYFSKKYMQPINQLAQASDKLKAGTWGYNDTIMQVKANGEMANLIGVFNSMANEINSRERKMKNTIRELELKIDKTKEDRMVSEITETDFFKQLERKSAELKSRK